MPHKLVLRMAIQLLPPKATSMASFSTVAQCVGYKPHRLIFAIGDAHLYRNHEAQARLQLSRTPYPLPRPELNPYKREIDAFLPEDVKLVGYQHHPALPAPTAV